MTQQLGTQTLDPDVDPGGKSPLSIPVTLASSPQIPACGLPGVTEVSSCGKHCVLRKWQMCCWERHYPLSNAKKHISSHIVASGLMDWLVTPD